MVHTVASRPARGLSAVVDGELELTKHEGAGNDFLVLVEYDRPVTLSADQVQLLCDRRRGVGADGLIVVGAARRLEQGDDRADLSMVLYNADASRAQMSGNGIRCLAQAAVASGLVAPGTFTVATDAGLRRVTFRPHDPDGHATASVDMGPVVLGEEVPSPVPGTRARLADVGNPHLVIVGDDVDLDGADLDQVAAAAGAQHPEGVNVELATPAGRPGVLRMRVHERGVGETLACGTGSCAVAAVAAGWGMVRSPVTVDNPGGELEVRLVGTVGGETFEAVLSGPVRHVADVVVRLDALAGDLRLGTP